jgi:hypothetical protein
LIEDWHCCCSVDVNNDNQRQESDPGQDDEHNTKADLEANEQGQWRIEEDNLQPSSETVMMMNMMIPLLSFYDPRTWDNLDNCKRDILIEKRPMRELDLDFTKNVAYCNGPG